MFQGGGAKGVAYAGALAAVEAKGQWFSAVAGASAGALTAALVAAGYRSKDLQAHTSRLLTSIQPASRVDRVLTHLPGLKTLVRYDSVGLERQIEDLLTEVLPPIHDSGSVRESVSFSQLYQASGIGLYVVATDSTSALPVLFCYETTPNLSVSAAVVASCALPIAFEPRYALITDSPMFSRGYASTSPLRRLQDGGVWANFPAFVFSDEAFRRFHGLPEIADEFILGFTLSDPRIYAQPDLFVDIPKSNAPTAGALTRYRRAQPNDGSRHKLHPGPVRVAMALLAAVVLCLTGFLGVGLALTADTAPVHWVGGCLLLVAVAGALLGSALGRTALKRSPLALIMLCALSVYTLFGTVQACRTVSLTLWATFAVGILGSACALALLLAGIVYEKTRTAIFSGATDVFNVLMLQAVTPAPWMDALDRSHLIVVPCRPLDTTTFQVGDDVSKQVIREARQECLQQLDQILAGIPGYQARMTPPDDERLRSAVADLTRQMLETVVSRHRI